MNSHSRRRLRQQLDLKLQAVKAVDPAVPRTGWIRSIRDALGMTAAQLAARLGVSQPALTFLEQSETAGTITLRSLSETAEALDCRVVYALVPKASLEETIRYHALRSAAAILKPVAHSMALEDQKTLPSDTDAEIQNLANDLIENSPTRIWTTDLR